MAELSDLRRRIDEIDSRIFELFAERTKVAEEVAAYKRESGMRIFDPVRERAKVADAAARGWRSWSTKTLGSATEVC